MIIIVCIKILLNSMNRLIRMKTFLKREDIDIFIERYIGLKINFSKVFLTTIECFNKERKILWSRYRNGLFFSISLEWFIQIYFWSKVSWISCFFFFLDEVKFKKQRENQKQKDVSKRIVIIFQVRQRWEKIVRRLSITPQIQRKQTSVKGRIQRSKRRWERDDDNPNDLLVACTLQI